jgi:hypothetical protein
VSVVLFYGVGAGDSAGDGEGASVAPRVLGGFLFADLFVPDGVGDALVVAGAAAAVVPYCCVQEATNAVPIKAVINENTYLFIMYIFSSRCVECLVVNRMAKRNMHSRWKPNRCLEFFTTGGEPNHF